MVPQTATIRKVSRETADCFTWTLEHAAPFTPGQFNMLYDFGMGEVAISISGDPFRADRTIHTIRAVGSVTQHLRQLKRGAVIGVRGPYGSGWPVDAARGQDLLIVAGGLGLAPLRPVIYHLLRRRKDFGRCTLLYGTRTPSDILYRRELETWRSRLDFDVAITVDRGQDDWRGHVGVVPSLLKNVAVDATKTVALLCGPEVMMRFTIRELQRCGVPDDRIYLSMERNMKCGVGFCGHCQYSRSFVCKDGPIYRYDRIRDIFWVKEL